MRAFILFQDRGLTLIEIMIVLAILAFATGLAIPQLGGSNYKIRSSMRRMALLSQQARDKAKVQRSTYRLVIELQNENPDQAINRYWLEKAEGRELLPSLEQLQEDEAADAAADKDPSTSTSDFQPADTGGEPKELPKPLVFDAIEVQGFDDEFRFGRVYIYYSPQGLVQEAAIHFKASEDTRWTLALHPLTGKGELQAGRVSLEELQDR